MSTAISMTLTDAGQAALWNAKSTGVDLELTHVQLGSGNKAPDASETALLTAEQYVAIASGTKVSDSQIRIRALFSGSVDYDVSEIALWSGVPGADGSVLFCYWSKESGVLLKKYAGVDFVFVHDMTIASTIDGASITITADDGQSTFLALLSTHENASNPHPLYAKLISPKLTTPDIGAATGTSFNSITGLSGTAPVADGAAAVVGVATTAARSDHVHPIDTTRAPLASPIFTGAPAAPTPAQFDADTSLATTEFVQRALGNLSGYSILSASATVSAASAGKHILISGTSAAITLAMPSASALPTLGGASFHFFNASLYSVTIKFYGSEVLQVVSSSVSSITLLPGDTLSIDAIAGTIWEPISGSAMLKYSLGFGSSLATNGYQKLPSGKIRQWGTTTVTTAGTGQVVTLPLTYPTAHLWNMGSSWSLSSYGGSFGTALSTITVWGSNAGAAIAWESIGD